MKEQYQIRIGKRVFTFGAPVLNERNLVEFRNGDLFIPQIPFSPSWEVEEKEGLLRVKDEMGTPWMVFRIEDEAFLEQVRLLKKEMVEDVWRFCQRLADDEEALLLFEDVPLTFTSSTILKKGLFPKYKAAVVYVVNQKAGKVLFQNIEELLQTLHQSEKGERSIYDGEPVRVWKVSDIVRWAAQKEMALA
ncbi:hypothetical protein [Geobacillus subterraneus]|uniref:Uncharacterized protein n=1 Tax=Geobacillus subterraneus TaxID=129338 RepID=A0A679FW95_9BACL|nr:hypothetical protein [Geobacillus subterraneus]BBW98965.1 hypothetical protein GsuE55_37980 [Geobacillus subterraneus]